MAEDECRGCRDGLLSKEPSIKEWHDEYLQLAIYAVSLVDENAKLRELLQASLRDFRRIYDCDDQDGWKMVDAIDRMVIGMRELGLDAGCTEQELRIKVL